MARRHPLFARLYARMAPSARPRGMADERQALVARRRGAVREIGAGSGLTFAHYPPGVAQVVATEPEPSVREQAGRAAPAAPVEVVITECSRVRNGAVALAVPFWRGSATAQGAS